MRAVLCILCLVVVALAAQNCAQSADSQCDKGEKRKPADARSKGQRNYCRYRHDSAMPDMEKTTTSIEMGLVEEQGGPDSQKLPLDRECFSCVLFSQNLHDHIQLQQPKLDHPNPKKFFAVRAQDTIEKAIDDSATMFVWSVINDIEEALHLDGRRGYWAISDIERSKVIDSRTMHDLKMRAASGGDWRLRQFLLNYVQEIDDDIETLLITNEFYEGADAKPRRREEVTAKMLKLASSICGKLCPYGVSEYEFPNMLYIPRVKRDELPSTEPDREEPARPKHPGDTSSFHDL